MKTSPIQISSASEKIESNIINNNISILTSIENQNNSIKYKQFETSKDIIEVNTKNSSTDKDSSSKRYSISQNIQDKFYAIHHIQSSAKETELNATLDENISSDNIIGTIKILNNKKLSNRGRKRIAPHNNDISKKSSDQSILPFHQTDSLKPKKLRYQFKNKKDQHNNPTLYQTCNQIWPENNNHVKDFNYSQIKSLSDLLKVRLIQAKFKMISKLDKDNEMLSFLNDESLTPPPKSQRKIRIQNIIQQRSTSPVIGNCKNLFNRSNKLQKLLEISSNRYTTLSSTENYMKTKNLKKKLLKSTGTKPKRISTPKRKSVAADILPVSLLDGSTVYVCEPCNKKYKNRNGLAYHMERCKHLIKIDNGDTEDGLNDKLLDQTPSENSINCICLKTADENSNMVQCEKCRCWSHSDCVDVADDSLEDVFCCSKCKEITDDETKTVQSELSDFNQAGKDLLQCLLEAQLTDSKISSQSSELHSHLTDSLNQHQQSQLKQLHELLSQPKLNDYLDNNLKILENKSSSPNDFINEQEDDTTSEKEATTQNDPQDSVSSSAHLHIWNDFNMSSSSDKSNQENWNVLDEDENFSPYETDLHSSTWNMSDLNIFSLLPSLLFSETNMSSSLEDDSMPSTNELDTPGVNNSSPPDCGVTPKMNSSLTPSSVNNTHNSDGLWFQFANFDDDYQCEN